jgi:hypothetical protein
MSRAPKSKKSCTNPITLDYVKGILSVIQSRTKATRSYNDHSGTKLVKQKAECEQFKEVFPHAKMSEETLKTWFKFAYDMTYDIFKTTINFHTRTGRDMTLAEERSATIKILTFGLETPDPRQGNL